MYNNVGKRLTKFKKNKWENTKLKVSAIFIVATVSAVSNEHWSNNFYCAIFTNLSKTLDTFAYIIDYSLHIAAKFIAGSTKSTKFIFLVFLTNCDKQIDKTSSKRQCCLMLMIWEILVMTSFWRGVSRFHKWTRFVCLNVLERKKKKIWFVYREWLPRG